MIKNDVFETSFLFDDSLVALKRIWHFAVAMGTVIFNVRKRLPGGYLCLLPQTPESEVPPSLKNLRKFFSPRAANFYFDR